MNHRNPAFAALLVLAAAAVSAGAASAAETVRAPVVTKQLKAVQPACPPASGVTADEIEGLRAQIAAARAKFESAVKDLDAEDKLSNFEIQDLMSRFNQAEQTASTLAKKQHDTAKSIIQNMK